MSRAKHWQFTINNYNDEHESLLAAEGERDDVAYLIYGKEVGSSGTPHLQGHVSYRKQLRFSKVKERLPDGAHLEVVRLLQSHIEYCKKDGNYSEFGTPPKLGNDARSASRVELDEFRATVASGVFESPDLREKHPNVMARYPHFARSVVRDLFPKPEKLPASSLRPWQQRVVELLDAPVDPRRIFFVVDERGNSGKTYLGRFLLGNYEKVQVLRAGKVADMALIYSVTTKILVVDVPRQKVDTLQYNFLEQVKDGMLLSGKYESQMKIFKPPHVLVMMNEEPDRKALSEDRYHIIKPL